MIKESHKSDAEALYRQFIDAWNTRNAQAMADLFTNEGKMIGFDGSQSIGREEVFSHLQPIFTTHPTPSYVSILKDCRLLGSNVVLVSAIAGMAPPDQIELDSGFNALHTLVASKKDGKWLIELFQNTPAQFHGRPELVKKMTDELRSMGT